MYAALRMMAVRLIDCMSPSYEKGEQGTKRGACLLIVFFFFYDDSGHTCCILHATLCIYMKW
mgnify:CR=1 FL=1|jgi:hypothetical protein